MAVRSREPVYQEKALSVWLDQYCTNHESQPGSDLDKDAETAIRHFGTNAIPTYLHMITDKGSPLTLQLIAHTSSKWRNRLHIPDLSDYQLQLDDRRVLGAVGIAALGDEAKPAIPILIGLLHETNEWVRIAAATALGSLGPAAHDAVPALMTCLNDPDAGVRLSAASGLGQIHQNSEQVIQILIKQAEGRDANTRWAAVESLGQFGAQAKPAVPILVGFLNDSDEMMRLMATNALRNIDPEAAEKAGVRLLRKPE